MGFFDNLLSSANVAVAKPTINNENEAFLTTVVAAASSDGDIESEEWDTIIDTLFQKRMFDGVDLYALVEECKTNIKGYSSLATAVNECAVHIQPHNKDVLFTICADIVLIDGKITTNEQAIIEHMKDQLGISDDFASKTIEVMLVRNKGNA